MRSARSSRGPLMLAVAVQRDRPAARPVGPETALAMLDKEVLVEQAPPEHDRLAGKLRVDLVDHALDRDPGVAADLAPFRLAGKAQNRSQAHIAPEPALGQAGEPILAARAAGRAMWLGVVVQQVAPQPEVGLRLGLGLVEMVEGLVRLFTVRKARSTLPFDRAVGRRPSLPVGRWVMTRTPRCSITPWKTRLFAIGPLSR